MRFLRPVVAIALLAAGTGTGVTACTSDRPSAESTPALGADPSGPSATLSDPSSAVSTVSSTGSPVASTAVSAVVPTSGAAPSPTGVPGIAVGDQFCAAWARYSGTVQVIAVAVHFAKLSSIQSAVLELESAPTIVDAVAEIDRTWPAALADEHRKAVDQYLGPYQRRAAKALEALHGAGLSAAEVDAVSAAWSKVLATRDPDVPMVTVDIPLAVEAKLDGGATAFDAAVTPFGADPSLDVDLNVLPGTKRYLSTRCPDLASIGVGDDV
ncbi:MAG: hypothetical protein ABIQ39_12515 [Ilumatobacteraceae bacterium]